MIFSHLLTWLALTAATVQANPILHSSRNAKSHRSHSSLSRIGGANATANCFPFGTAKLSQDFTPPSVSRDDWWCPQSMFYGFLGFSYPMEGDCSSDVTSQIDSDFSRMKNDFGATMVRVYLPECYDDSIWEKLLDAGVKYNMAVVLQVAWPLNGDPASDYQLIENSILDVLANSTHAAIAPYVFHSADFGTEPIGDTDGGSYSNFIALLKGFRQKMQPYGIPVGISEDWDRPGIMSASDSNGLGPIGEQIVPLSDYIHAHVMPYYHNNLDEAGSWQYIHDQVLWYKRYIPSLPLAITETQWAWALNADHGGGDNDVGFPQYSDYWHNYDNNCAFFKAQNTGWFIHTWYGEDTFDMLLDNGTYAIANWRPQIC